MFNLLPDQDNSHFATYSLQLNADLGWGELTVIPAYSHSDRWVLTQLFAPDPQVATTWNENQYTGEVRLQSSENAKTSLAPFFQVTYPIVDRLRLTGGLRYTSDKKFGATRVPTLTPRLPIPYRTLSETFQYADCSSSGG